MLINGVSHAPAWCKEFGHQWETRWRFPNHRRIWHPKFWGLPWWERRRYCGNCGIVSLREKL
jgi:hypothetical protein